MNIRRLEIFGFKSFKNKTVLEFNSNLTGVVGPNGCGKSNIVDAILWVMGETSAKSLRGTALSDVIFKGTSRLPAGSFAEVSLLLEKGEGGFPEKYKEFSELMVRRRVERDGASACFINQSPCRLKDIKDIFMDTGAGCRGFSVIEQEAVEKLITAKPLERRMIIEEVAGISKFKNRKLESLRKLDQVQGNLGRLNDILKTQGEQLRRLSRQVKAAEKYRNFKKEIREREKEIYFRGLKKLEMEIQKLDQNYSQCLKLEKEIQAKKEKKQSHSRLVEKDIKKMENLLKEDEKYITELELKIMKCQKEIESGEATLGIYTENLKNQNLSLENLKKEIMEAEIKIKNREKELNDISEEEKKKEESLQSLADGFQEMEDLPDLRKRKEELGIEMERHRAEKNEYALKEGILKSKNEFFNKEIESIQFKEQKLDLKLGKLLKDKNHKGAHLTNYRNLKRDLERDKVAPLKNIQTFNEKKSYVEEEITRLSRNISQFSYKIEESEKLVNHFESPNEGTSHLLKWKSKEYRPLIKNIVVAPNFETAVQVALDHHLYALLSENEEAIRQGIDWLKQNKKGKAGFLFTPEKKIDPSHKEEREKIKSFPAFICFLSEKITFSLQMKSLFQLAHRTVVVSNLYSALDMKKQFPDFQFVTKEGDFISQNNMIYGGSYENKTNIFKIRNQIEKFKEELSSHQTALALKETSLQQVEEDLKSANASLSFMEKKEKEIVSHIHSLEKEEEVIKKDMLRMTEEKDSLQKNQNQLKSDQKEILHTLSLLEKNRKKEEEMIATKENILNNLMKRLGRLESLPSGKYQLEMELLSLQKEREIKQREMDMIHDFLHQSSDKRSLALETEKKLQNQIKELRANTSQTEKELDLQKEEIERVRKKFDSDKEKVEKKQEDLLKVFKEIEQIDGELEQNKKDIYEATLQKEKQSIQRQSKMDHMSKEYGVDWDQKVFIPQYEKLGEEELENERDRMLKELDKMGEVNLIALKEYENLLKDNLFLTDQKEDLSNSKKELLKIISHVDSLCHKRFASHLDEINFRFSRVFPIVFEGEGGEARLVLNKEEEGEEAGVDIMVRPPGKKLQNVNLLSRGEKALTAICLVYSLFLVKPSPFCVLDEVDAPLDDVNNFRFLSVLRQMAAKSRIIAITHNKRTMEICDHLYGVTVKEPGVSQVVSLNLEKSRKKTISS